MKLSKTKIKKNILAVWNQCSENDKYDWYAEAHSFAKSLTSPGLSLVQSCGIVAALSPMKQWNENKRIAALLAKENIDSGIHTSTCTQKALRIKFCASEGQINEQMVLDILNGEKIKSFFINILHPEKVEHVTIDRHAYSIAVGRKMTDRDMKLTKKQYTYYADIYRELAKELGVSPSLLQSATWVRWRNPQFSLF